MIDEIQLIRDLEHMKEREDLGVPCSMNNIIALVEKQPKVSEWIPVEKELPKDEFRYLVMLSNCWQQVAFYDGENWVLVCDEDILVENYYRKVIAWMPLPVPYGGNEDE